MTLLPFLRHRHQDSRVFARSAGVLCGAADGVIFKKCLCFLLHSTHAAQKRWARVSRGVPNLRCRHIITGGEHRLRKRPIRQACGLWWWAVVPYQHAEGHGEATGNVDRRNRNGDGAEHSCGGLNLSPGLGRVALMAFSRAPPPRRGQDPALGTSWPQLWWTSGAASDGPLTARRTGARISTSPATFATTGIPSLSLTARRTGGSLSADRISLTAQRSVSSPWSWQR